MRVLQVEASAKGPAEELAKVRAELERVSAEKADLAKAAKTGAEELAREKARLAELEKEREAAKKTAAKSESSVKKPAAELAKLKVELERLVQEKTALKVAKADELALERARFAELVGEREALEARALQAESTAKKPAEELVKVRAELERVIKENAAAAKALEEERSREKSHLGEVEHAREVALRRAEQTDAATKALSSEMERLIEAKAVIERTSTERIKTVEDRLHVAERERDAVSHRNEEREKDVLALQAKVEELSKKVVIQMGAAASVADIGLEKLLETRELEIKKLTEQLGQAVATNRNSSQSTAQRTSGWLPQALERREAVAAVSLAVGLVVGVGVSRLVSPSDSVPPAQVAGAPAAQSKEVAPAVSQTAKEVEIPSPKTPPEPSVASGSSSVAGSITPAPVPQPATTVPPPSAPAQSGTPGSASGMPNKLPDSFLGMRFGTSISDLATRGQWQETAGRLHRKAELLGTQVEAVLSQDEEGRLIMGSYVRIVPREEAAVGPFLEWAVNSQDAVSALYGEPSRMHQVEGASDATEVVRRITSGEDFYEAGWEREGEDTMMDLSIRVFNARSVVFRLEYRSRELVSAYSQRREANKEKAPEKTDEETPK